MKTLQECYRTAQQENIAVDHFPLRSRDALSIMEPDGTCYIAIDRRKLTSQNDERTKLSHELGHCITGSFYNEYSNFDCRQRHENRADKWAIRYLIPVDALDDAVAMGHTELWALAEHFGVSEAFMKKAVCLYVHGNVAQELYF